MTKTKKNKPDFLGKFITNIIWLWITGFGTWSAITGWILLNQESTILAFLPPNLFMPEILIMCAATSIIFGLITVFWSLEKAIAILASEPHIEPYLIQIKNLIFK